MLARRRRRRRSEAEAPSASPPSRRWPAAPRRRRLAADRRRSGAGARAAASSSSTTAPRTRSSHLLEQAGAVVEVVRHDASAADILAPDPDGVLLANGPGDPGAMDAHVARGARRCSTAAGRSSASASATSCSAGRSASRPSSCRFGHRGANHPVLERATGRVLVTSQNHGFAVRAPDARRASEIDVTHVSLYDRHGRGPAVCAAGRVWSMQFHPEASPGPARRARSRWSASSSCAASRDAREAR